MIWGAVVVGSLCCYGLKLAGLSVPRRILENPRVERMAALLPVALIAALVVIQGFTTGHEIVIDARAAGLAAAVVAIRLRAPFLVTVAVAALVTALLRLVT
ncbi:MAG TPA: AzlD domain-containing protein [Actinomycetota bacterium]|nr:AzlD domain-containing protein [Actinomycetota bacterium]